MSKPTPVWDDTLRWPGVIHASDAPLSRVRPSTERNPAVQDARAGADDVWRLPAGLDGEALRAAWGRTNGRPARAAHRQGGRRRPERHTTENRRRRRVADGTAGAERFTEPTALRPDMAGRGATHRASRRSRAAPKWRIAPG